MKYLKKYESPDKLMISDKSSTYGIKVHNHNDLDSVSFGYQDNEMRITRQNKDRFTQQARGTLTHDDLCDDGRAGLDYPGRMWMKSKYISFWEYPRRLEMEKVLKDIENAYNNGKKYFTTNVQFIDGKMKGKYVNEKDGKFYFKDEEIFIDNIKDLDEPRRDSMMMPLSIYVRFYTIEKMILNLILIGR